MLCSFWVIVHEGTKLIGILKAFYREKLESAHSKKNTFSDENVGYFG